jgi:hypothetical protein
MHATMHVVHKSEKQHATMHVVHKYEKQPATMHVVHKSEKQHATMHVVHKSEKQHIYNRYQNIPKFLFNYKSITSQFPKLIIPCHHCCFK